MPDFGIFRGFNDKLFGDKLYAGQLPTNLGLIGSSDVDPFDIDAKAFFDRVISAGGTLSATEKTAVNTLVLQMKTDLIWTKMKSIYPMVGASAAACAQNLKSSSFTGTFTAGWTFASTGVTPNGTSAYMNTNVQAEIDIFGIDVSMGFYSRTNVQNTGGDIGNFGTSNLNSTAIYPNYLGLLLVDVPNETNRAILSGVTNSLGFFQTNNSSTVSRNTFRNLGKIINTSFINSPLSTPTNRNMILGAAFSGARPSNRELAFAYFGNALTDTEADDFYNAVQGFQTTLSRQV